MKHTFDLKSLLCGCLTVVLSCTYDSLDLPPHDAGGSDGSTAADAASADAEPSGQDGSPAHEDSGSDGSMDADVEPPDADLPDAELPEPGGALELEPTWADAPEWSDYLSGPLDTPEGEYCPPDELHPLYCFRAGVLRKLVLADEASCEGLNASDAEHWYDWACDDTSGEVVFTSTMRPEVGLADVIDARKREWRANSVTVMRGDEVVAVTKSAALWAAPILPLPQASGGVIELDQEGAVYVATGTVEGAVHIAAHGVSLLGVGSATLGALEDDSPVLFTEERRAFVWLENLTIDADGHPAGADVELIHGVVRGLEVKRDALAATTAAPDLRIDAYASYLRDLVSRDAPGIGIELAGGGVIDTVHGVEVINAQGDGVWVTRSDGFISDVSVIGCGGDGMQSPNAARVTLNHITVADCDGDGVDTATGELVVLSDVVVTNNEGSGVALRGDDQLLTAVISANNEGDGVLLEGRNALLMHATTANNVGAGLHVASGASDNELINVVSANNETGLWLDGGSAGTLVHNAWLSANETDDVLVEGNRNAFSGTLDLGGLDACTLAGAPAEPGLSSPCAIAGPSTATLSFDNPLSTSDGALVGQLLESDPENSAHLSAGIYAYAAINDWRSFSVRQRHWGRPSSGSAFPDAAARGRCDAASACAIWDWRVTSQPSRIRDPIGLEGEALIEELGRATHVRKHVWYARNEEACLLSDHVSWVLTPEPECSTTFVDYALTPIHDGNLNSICVPGQPCFLNWNRGAFPGSGFGDAPYAAWQYPEEVLKLFSTQIDVDDGGVVEDQYFIDVPGLGQVYVFYFLANGD
jgi:hypothetical protein